MIIQTFISLTFMLSSNFKNLCSILMNLILVFLGSLMIAEESTDLDIDQSGTLGKTFVYTFLGVQFLIVLIIFVEILTNCCRKCLCKSKAKVTTKGKAYNQNNAKHFDARSTLSSNTMI
jgi:uncharacterized membrane protein